MADSYICSKAKIKCTFGDKISNLTVLPTRTIFLTGEPQGNISDHISLVNIAPFGKCHTVAYPPTGAATSANHGKLTPMPCIPNTPFPWMGGKNDVLLQNQPALLKSSTCKCIYGGTISFTQDGQTMGTGPDLTPFLSLTRRDQFEIEETKALEQIKKSEESKLMPMELNDPGINSPSTTMPVEETQKASENSTPSNSETIKDSGKSDNNQAKEKTPSPAPNKPKVEYKPTPNYKQEESPRIGKNLDISI